MSKKTVLLTLIAAILSAVMVYMGSNSATCAKLLGINTISNTPKQLYRVYLGGESIGLIKSIDELETFIDEKQTELKAKYNVDKVYVPNDLDVVQEITYNEKTENVEDIYNKIQKIKGDESFTIDGYKIVIHGIQKSSEDGTDQTTEDQTIYVLDKNIFTSAVQKTIKLFVNSTDYSNFINDTQPELTGEGKIIEDLYIKNNITIKKDRIPTGTKIYQTEEELSKYLLFGTTEDQSTYIVQEGDTIEEIAYNNKLSTEEFLIANTEYKTATDLLYPGKKVVLGIIKPQFDTVEETHTVTRKNIQKETVYEDDNTQYAGYEQVKEEGEDGISLVTEKIQYTNGEITSVVTITDQEKVIKPAVKKVVIRGTKQYTVSSGSSYNIDVPVGVGSWVWPTTTSTISSTYAYRWQSFHKAVDITGNMGSPIRAANNGVVVISSYTKGNGNYIIIKHANGYFTEYAHLAARYVQKGQIVYAGDTIGTMGKTGNASGVHLHFGLWTGAPYTGQHHNPLTLYQ